MKRRCKRHHLDSPHHRVDLLKIRIDEVEVVILLLSFRAATAPPGLEGLHHISPKGPAPWLVGTAARGTTQAAKLPPVHAPSHQQQCFQGLHCHILLDKQPTQSSWAPKWLLSQHCSCSDYCFLPGGNPNPGSPPATSLGRQAC